MTQSPSPRRGSQLPLFLGSMLVACIIGAAVIAVALLFIPGSPWQIGRPGTTVTSTDDGTPMVQALRALQKASSEKPYLNIQNGFPRFVGVQVAATGQTPEERARNFLQTYLALYRQDNADLKLDILRVSNDDAGDHVEFYQTYRDLPVYAGEITVNLNGNTVYATNGALLQPANLDTEPLLTAFEAETAARTAVNEPQGSPLRADPRLEIYDPAILDDVPPAPRLVWRIFLTGPDAPDVLVDARTGEVVVQAPTAVFNGGPLDGYDLDLETANGNWGNYCYYDTTDDDEIGDEDGLDRDYHSDAEAVAIWWHARTVYSFFHTTYNCHSYDCRRSQLELYIHAGGDVIEGAAMYRSGCEIIEFSNGNISLDILAHEFTHGIVHHSSNLVYHNQSGALNESYADVMASMVDNNWTIGDGRASGTGGIFRNLASPGRSHISQYVTSADTKAGDWGGVHGNSTIPSKAAQLLADGGTHNGWTIASIGRPRMGWLFYMTLRNLSSNAQFIDARNLAVSYARQYLTAHEVCQVRNAYKSVGLGDGDRDCDGTEDAADTDDDNDGIPDSRDNCPSLANPDQRNTDSDSRGDACDDDDDNDSVPDTRDNCPLVANRDQADANNNRIGDACEDTDGDTIVNAQDNCPTIANRDQRDSDSDGQGDVCDTDTDNDGVANGKDNCPRRANTDQADADSDGVGDVCDNCLKDANPDQRDTDRDGMGNVCDPDSDNDGIPNADDLCPNGELTCLLTTAPLAIPQNHGPVIRVPIQLPPCPACQVPNVWPETECVGLQTDGLPGTVMLITDNLGRGVTRSPNTAKQRSLIFHPLGGQQYFLNIAFKPDFVSQPGLTLPITLAAGACDKLPGSVTPPSGYEAPPQAGQPITVTTNIVTPTPTPPQTVITTTGITLTPTPTKSPRASCVDQKNCTPTPTKMPSPSCKDLQNCTPTPTPTKPLTCVELKNCTPTPTLSCVELKNCTPTPTLSCEELKNCTPTPTVPPSDTSGPAIDKLNASPNPSLYGSCGGLVTFSAYITDPSGLGNIQIWYRYEGKATGGWWSASKIDQNGDIYSATIDNNDGSQAYNVLAGGNGSIRWYVLATDGLGNNSGSSDQVAAIDFCPG